MNYTFNPLIRQSKKIKNYFVGTEWATLKRDG